MALEIKVTPIFPKVFNLDWVRLELLNMMRKEARYARSLYWKTTKTWTHKPTFKITGLSLRGGTARITVSTDSKIFGWVDAGTKSSQKPIVPKRPFSPSGRPSSLRFQPGYRRKTIPRRLTSSSGGRYGPFVHAVSVPHKGIKARHFTNTIAMIMRLRTPKEAENAIKRGIVKGIKL